MNVHALLRRGVQSIGGMRYIVTGIHCKAPICASGYQSVTGSFDLLRIHDLERNQPDPWMNAPREHDRFAEVLELF